MKKETFRVCPYCHEEATGLEPDGIDYCSECEHIIEGETLEVTHEEWEALCFYATPCEPRGRSVEEMHRREGGPA